VAANDERSSATAVDALPIEVVEYDSRWPAIFAELRDSLAGALEKLAVRIEHVGNTGVPGLAAEPTIDIDVVVRSRGDLAAAIGRLAAIGYVHRGELRNGPKAVMHSIVPTAQPSTISTVCPEGNEAFRRHIALRDYLRVHPESAAEYSKIKRTLALRFSTDISAYTNAKTAFIDALLERVLTETRRPDGR
jgi:GrpB-like predicted nucleotidyltransferase (UPF0157 family)